MPLPNHGTQRLPNDDDDCRYPVHIKIHWKKHIVSSQDTSTPRCQVTRNIVFILKAVSHCDFSVLSMSVSVSVHILANNALHITPVRMVVCRLMFNQIFVYIFWK